MTSKKEDLLLIENRIVQMVGKLARHDLFDDLSKEELENSKMILSELRELEAELKLELGINKTKSTFDNTFALVARKVPRFFNRFTYEPILKNTINPHVSYMGNPNLIETPCTILPSVYISGDEKIIKEAIAFIRSIYPDLVIERRRAKRAKTGNHELKLTNCYYEHILDFVEVDWTSLQWEEGHFLLLPSVFKEEDGMVIYGTEKTDFVAVFSFSNKTHLHKWFNFLKRGKSISGESSFLSGSVSECIQDIPPEQRLSPKGKHQLFIAGLSLPQVESILQFDFNNSSVEDIEDHFFDHGHNLSLSEQKDYLRFTSIQSNY